ncbi:MBL fold metallo-hydrolase [Luteibacter sp. 22Crub2.1]|uniref:MBL fold metallo-hydrolase n=1 Tax=Luteibacter sp. 22Crub2.1 TaxID=1283288 RepID=UPI0009A5712A|nr:MBL fold metallo-hydrolase [Luteibacter sp. 22Crub2.1]SKB27531.1 Glyoxylase, beta-lactamase superfamily II [Luteibacter sp. 22Crub2.1]
MKPKATIDMRALAAALFLSLAAMGAAASDDTPYAKINEATATAPVTVKELRGGVSALYGSGGNIGALVGQDGIFMVDAGIAVSRPKIEYVLKKLSKGPLRYMVNTHWHWDHADGNGWVHQDGATIIASAQTAKHLGESIRVEEWGHTFEPVEKDARPTLIVKGDKTMPFDGESVLIRPYVASHTDGDLSVYFKQADVLFTGDTWWNGLYPFIDYAEGGGINGMIAAADENVSLVTAHTIVVPGHGPEGTKADLIAYRDMLVSIRDKVAGLKKQGLSLEQVIAAKPTQAFDARWGQAVISPALFTTLVYRGV